MSQEEYERDAIDALNDLKEDGFQAFKLDTVDEYVHVDTGEKWQGDPDDLEYWSIDNTYVIKSQNPDYVDHYNKKSVPVKTAFWCIDDPTAAMGQRYTDNESNSQSAGSLIAGEKKKLVADYTLDINVEDKIEVLGEVFTVTRQLNIAPGGVKVIQNVFLGA